jgi:iron complex outermembrane receptor protein
LLGGYYLNANARTIFDVRLPNTVTALTFGDVDTETFAIFGDVTFDVTDQLSILGRRPLHLGRAQLGHPSPGLHRRRLALLRRQRNALRAAVRLRRHGGLPAVHAARLDHLRDHRGPDHLCELFARLQGRRLRSARRLHRLPQPDGRRLQPQQLFDFMSFEPETVDSFELGYRASLFDRRLTFSLAAFHAEYKDVQVPGSVGVTLNGQQTFIGVTTNAGRARFQGLEFEGNAVLLQDFGTDGGRLGFSWTMGYINADYLEFIDARGIDVADRRKIQNTPELTASGTLNYSAPLMGGNLNASTTLAYRSSSQQFELRTPGLDQPAFALLDANLVWRSDDDRFTVGLHGRNLTDKRYIVSGYNFLRQNPDTGNFVLANGQPGLSPTLGNQGADRLLRQSAHRVPVGGRELLMATAGSGGGEGASGTKPFQEGGCSRSCSSPTSSTSSTGRSSASWPCRSARSCTSRQAAELSRRVFAFSTAPSPSRSRGSPTGAAGSTSSPARSRSGACSPPFAASRRILLAARSPRAWASRSAKPAASRLPTR